VELLFQAARVSLYPFWRNAMTNFAQPNRIISSEAKIAYYNPTVLLACVALAAIFSVAIYLACISPGTSPDELALMTVYP
jgi:hypothetical protein